MTARRPPRDQRLTARLARHNRGATTIEYALILGLIAITMLVGMRGAGNVVTGMWNNVSQNVVRAT